jgi:hypothetical protein
MNGLVIPNRTVLLLAGLPATGKSEFGRYLAQAHGFAHFDLENGGWPSAVAHEVWNQSRSEFVALIRNLHDRVALDWGFPPAYLSWAHELSACSVKPIWFGGDRAQVRANYTNRALRTGRGTAVELDRQLCAIDDAALPGDNGFLVIERLSVDGAFLSNTEVLSRIFA